MEDTRLGAILLQHGVVSEATLRECLEIQSWTGGQRLLGEILVEHGALSSRDLERVLGIQQGWRTDAPAPIAVEGDDTDRFLRVALAKGATEILLSEGRVPLARIGGDLRPLGDEPLAGPEVWNFVRDQMGLAVLEEIAESCSVTRALVDGGRVRGRVTAFRHFDGLAITVRLQPETVREPDAARIDPAIAGAMRTGKGMLLLAGEQGSGVTGAFATLLHEAAREAGRSIVVLDRVFEYPEPDGPALLTMRRVGEHTRDFRSGMRTALQEGADVVFLADLDRSTFDLALHAAAAGSLVVAAVRARSAVAALERVVRFRPPSDEARMRSRLASALLGVLVVQTLPGAAHEHLELATEVLLPDDSVRDLLRAGAFSRMRSLLRVGGPTCGHDLDSSLGALVESGAVRFEDAFAHADDKAKLLQIGSTTEDVR